MEESKSLLTSRLIFPEKGKIFLDAWFGISHLGFCFTII